MSLMLNFYGCQVVVDSACAALVEEIRRDYAFFVGEKEARTTLTVIMCLEPPDYASLPSLPASLFTPRNVCYHATDITYIDYFGQGLAIFERKKNHCVVYGADFDRVREIAYFYILSTIGQYLDARGLHRIHALGVNYRERGVLLLLPSGGGKSTMSLELLRRPGFTLLGEDTPLIDRHGDILPFPLRLGVRAEQDPDIPKQFLRTVQRMEFDPKTLIDIEYFQDRLSGPIRPGCILVGQRNLGSVSSITPLARRKAFKALLKYMIVGLGIYQGLEFLLERGAWEMMGKGGLAASRTRNALKLLARAPSYRFTLGRDRDQNCVTLLEFLERSHGEDTHA
jgi:hypothetical protein